MQGQVNMKLSIMVATILMSASLFAQDIALPTRQQSEQIKTTGFFNFNPDQEHGLHPNKKCYAIFVLSHVALWGSVVAAVKNPRSREDAHSEYPAVAAMTGIDFLAFKFWAPFMGEFGSGYGTVHYTRAAMR